MAAPPRLAQTVAQHVHLGVVGIPAELEILVPQVIRAALLSPFVITFPAGRVATRAMAEQVGLAVLAAVTVERVLGISTITQVTTLASAVMGALAVMAAVMGRLFVALAVTLTAAVVAQALVTQEPLVDTRQTAPAFLGMGEIAEEVQAAIFTTTTGMLVILVVQVFPGRVAVGVAALNGILLWATEFMVEVVVAGAVEITQIPRILVTLRLL